MFKEKKLFVLFNAFAFKDDFLKQGELFIKSDNTLVLYQEGDVPNNDKFFNF